MQETQEPIENENLEDAQIDSTESTSVDNEETEEESSEEDHTEEEEIESVEGDEAADEYNESSDEIDESIIGEDSIKLPSKSVPTEEELRLSWLVDDYDGITENIYEAVIVAARRARQIGRLQKQEVDDLNSSMEVVDLINNEEEEGLEPGVDHFHHMKPTIQAMKELKNQSFTYSYPEDLDDEDDE